MKKLKNIFAIITIFTSVVVIQALMVNEELSAYEGRTGYLPHITEKEIDIEEPKQNINNSLKKATKFTDTYIKANIEIKKALAALKKARTPKNIEKLHIIYANHNLKIVENIVEIIKDKDLMLDSLSNIDRTFLYIGISLADEKEKIIEDEKKDSKKLGELAIKAGKLARQYLEQASDELRSKLSKLKTQIEVLKYRLKFIPGQRKNVDKFIAQNEAIRRNCQNLSRRSELYIDKLDAVRNNFSTEAKLFRIAYQQEKAWVNFDGSAPNDIFNAVEEYSKTMKEMLDVLSTLSTTDSAQNVYEQEQIYEEDLDVWIKNNADN